MSHRKKKIAHVNIHHMYNAKWKKKKPSEYQATLDCLNDIIQGQMILLIMR